MCPRLGERVIAAVLLSQLCVCVCVNSADMDAQTEERV